MFTHYNPYHSSDYELQFPQFRPHRWDRNWVPPPRPDRQGQGGKRQKTTQGQGQGTEGLGAEAGAVPSVSSLLMQDFLE